MLEQRFEQNNASDTRQPRGRWWLIISFVACFFWLSIEDTSMLLVVLLAVNLALAFAFSRFTYISNLLTHLWQWILLGASIGISAVLLTAGLMFFKTAWHSHQYPDFPLPMIVDMLTRLPVWGLAGALIGLAWYTFRHAHKQEH